MTHTFEFNEEIVDSVDFLLVDRFDLEDPSIDEQLADYLHELPVEEMERAILSTF